MKQMRRSRLFFLGFCILTACKFGNQQQSNSTLVVKVPVFNEDTAFASIEKQVSFGPRVPNTPAHKACAEYLVSKLKSFSDHVFVQEAVVTAFDGTKLNCKNVIASFYPEKKQRIMICTHWDARPFADQDTKDTDKPIDAANDGGSGVGVIMELARHLKVAEPSVGVDFILFDAEDYGQPENVKKTSPGEDTYCLGTQYWAKNPPVPNYRPMYGILLDMVGGKDATFTMEGVSMLYASSIVQKVWDAGNRIGYSDYFLYKKTPEITDDHLYINQIANIPTIDIIHYDESSPSHIFPVTWHTHADNLSNIDKKTLKAVGQTLLEVIFKEEITTNQQ